LTYLSDKYQFDTINDIKLVTVGSALRIMDYYNNNHNSTSYGLAFCTTYWDSEYVSFPCQLEHDTENKKELYFYSLIYNSTLVSESVMEDYTNTMQNNIVLLRLKQDVDSAILNYKFSTSNYSSPAPEIEISASHFPETVDRFVEGVNIIAFMGSYWFNLPSLVTFLMVVVIVIEEKQLKLRQGLNVIGVSHSLYWVHWAIT